MDLNLTAYLYLGLASFGFLHAFRDYLQMHQRWSWFTRFGHFWDAPQYERYSLAASIGFGLLFSWLFLQALARS